MVCRVLLSSLQEHCDLYLLIYLLFPQGPMITYLARAPDGTDITTWLPGTEYVTVPSFN